MWRIGPAQREVLQKAAEDSVEGGESSAEGPMGPPSWAWAFGVRSRSEGGEVWGRDNVSEHLLHT